jgi:hypothetical protein
MRNLDRSTILDGAGGVFPRPIRVASRSWRRHTVAHSIRDLRSLAMKTSTNGRHRKNGTTAKALEARVARLESEVARLKKVSIPTPVVAGGWESIVGSQPDNPFFDLMVREMKRERGRDYAEARREAAAARKKTSTRRVTAGAK